ncbi:hypothetical protein VP01_1414g3 [Puccinia sorghi]|uniref:Uncharacterized protein n=1 Tax=Puccinia sorghi TaxID=27349 RepID=A0A0L6VKS4_9BASI|nr:hypothetical protein VP01_1414g3 [Puccinia sorghi]
MKTHLTTLKNGLMPTNVNHLCFQLAASGIPFGSPKLETLWFHCGKLLD